MSRSGDRRRPRGSCGHTGLDGDELAEGGGPVGRPDVAVTIDVGDTPDRARALLIRGRAAVESVDGVSEEYLAGARKVMDAEAVVAFEQACRVMYDQMARIAITPHWVRYYDFGAGLVPRSLQDLADRSAARARETQRPV